MEVNNSETPTDGSISVDDLIVLEGELNGAAFQILKDNGCNTSIPSRRFVELHPDLLVLNDTNMCVTPSKRGPRKRRYRRRLEQHLPLVSIATPRPGL